MDLILLEQPVLERSETTERTISLLFVSGNYLIDKFYDRVTQKLTNYSSLKPTTHTH